MDKPIPPLAMRGTHASGQLALRFRVEALDLVEEASESYVHDTRRWLAHLQDLTGKPVTVNDAREYRPPPTGVDPRVMGSLMREPLFKVVDSDTRDRAPCHGRATSGGVPAGGRGQRGGGRRRAGPGAGGVRVCGATACRRLFHWLARCPDRRRPRSWPS